MKYASNKEGLRKLGTKTTLFIRRKRAEISGTYYEERRLGKFDAHRV